MRRPLRIPQTPLRDQVAMGTPYFHPLPAMPSDAELEERRRKLQAAGDLQDRAWVLSNTWEEHTRDDYSRAAVFYDELVLLYDELGNRQQEADTARHDARRCREKAGL